MKWNRLSDEFLGRYILNRWRITTLEVTCDEVDERSSAPAPGHLGDGRFRNRLGVDPSSPTSEVHESRNNAYKARDKVFSA